ncbi:hypothetical protein [Marinomonas posidonica]
MPLLIPLASVGFGFVAGFFTGSQFGWIKWLLIALAAWFVAKKMGVV